MDARLVPLALGMWLSSALVVYSSGRLNPTSIIVFLAVALSVATAVPRLRFRTAVVLSLLGILAGSAIGLVRTVPLHTQVVASAIEQERIVVITGFITADPIIFERTQALDWVTQNAAVVEISARSLTVADDKIQLHLPMSVFSSAQNYDYFVHLVPGTFVQISGKISGASPGKKYAATINATDVVEIRGPPSYQAIGAKLRNGLHEALASYSPAAQGLVPGLALGDSSALDAATKKDMRAAGLTHLIAVSGANVALLLALMYRFTFRYSLRSQLVLNLVALAAYVVLVRPQPSVVRAATMAVVVLMAHTSRWKVKALPALSAAVIVLIGFDPWLSTSYGFVLSVLATAGLITVAQRMQHSFERTLPHQIPLWVLELLAVTTAAQLAVLPIVISLGSQISLASIPANVLAVPLATPAMFSGLAAAFLSVLSEPLAHFIVLPGVWSAQTIAWIARVTAQETALTVKFPAGVIGVVVALVVVATIFHMWKSWHGASAQQREMMATVLVVTTFLVWWRPDLSMRSWPDSNWKFVMCDVGQGDGLVLRTGKQSAIVIDAGVDPELIDECLRQLHITQIPILVLTHFHADHVGGIEGVYRHRTVSRVWVTSLQEPELTTAFALAGVKQHANVPEVMSQLHHEVIGPVDLQVVWPARIIMGQGSDPNNASVALLVTIDSHTLFLSGDLEPAAQAAIVETWPVGHVDYVKVAHHGSAHQYPALIERLSPEHAFISVGKDNDYGHPALETLALFNAVGATVWRTDTRGAIAVIAGEKSWFVQSAR